MCFRGLEVAVRGCPYTVCQAAVGSFVAGWGGVEGSISDHGVQGQDAAVGQGEDCLVMAFALVSFALVIGPRYRV